MQVRSRYMFQSMIFAVLFFCITTGAFASKIAIGDDGSVYTVYGYNAALENPDASSEEYVIAIVKYDKTGKRLAVWKNKNAERFGLLITTGLNGNIYLLDKRDIHVFNTSGKKISKIVLHGNDTTYAKNPTSITISKTGDIYITDTEKHVVYHYDKSGMFISSLGGPGSEKGQFDFPAGVAVDSKDNVYVADTDNFRIQKFDSNGKYITEWGGWGHENGQFLSPYALDVDSQDNLYVMDPEARRIQVFDSSGKFKARWGEQGMLDTGKLHAPIGISAGADNNVYIYDETGHSGGIIRFTTDGKFLNQWSPEAAIFRPQEMSEEGMRMNLMDDMLAMMNITDMIIDADGNLYVSLTGNSIRKYDSKGKLLLQWGWTLDYFAVLLSKGQFEGIFGIASDGKGGIYAADAGLSNICIQMFDSTGKYVSRISSQWDRDDYLNVSGLALIDVDGNGNIYGLSTNDTIVKISSDGKIIKTWSAKNKEQGEFGVAPGFAVDAKGNVYLSDPAGNVIRKYDSDGKMVLQIGGEGSGPGKFNIPLGLAVDSNGNLYVADTGNSRIQKFDSSGKLILKWTHKTWGSMSSSNDPGNAANQEDLFSKTEPQLVALSPKDGNVYVKGFMSGTIDKFTPDGKFIETIDLSKQASVQ